MAGPNQGKAATPADATDAPDVEKLVNDAVAAAVAKALEGQQEAVDKAVADALAAQQAQFADLNKDKVAMLDELVSASSGESAAEAASEPTQEYELLASGYHRVLSAPGKPLRVQAYVTGEMVPLTAERAAELIRDGAVRDPDATEADERGAQTAAPKGKAPKGAVPAGVGASTGGGYGAPDGHVGAVFTDV